MAHRTFFNIGKLIQAAESLLPEVEVVSFDLFDTLMVRRTHDPDLVKIPVARFISSMANDNGIDLSFQQIQEIRDEIEQRFRDETGGKFDDHEAHYPTFMAKTLRNIFTDKYDDDILKTVTEYELKMENAMLVPRLELVRWLEKISEQGKRIVVISDMYLPSDHLKVLLDHAGLLNLCENVFSSADSFLAKASGKGYEFVQKSLDVSANQWMHIGDNPISDGLKADEFGVHALVLQDTEELRRRAIAARYYFYGRKRAFWKGRALQQLMAPLEGENIPRSALYTEGYNFFGPLVGMFVQSVAEHCRENGITKIFFLSREGWMFKQVWEKIMPFLFPDNKIPEVEYLYVSRLSLAGASCAEQGMTADNVRIVFLPPGNKNFSDVCRIFDLDMGPLKPHLQRYKLNIETTLSPLHSGFDPEHSWRLEELLKDSEFQNEIKRQTKPRNDALQAYLSGLEFFHHKDVALVDIGWLGTIQRFFHDSIKHISDRPVCHGLLFGATRGIPFPTTVDNHILGLIYDRERFDFASSTILYARDIFEEACRAPHPTTVGYKINNDGSAEPIFREMEDKLGQSEMEQDKYYSDLQQGILDSADRYGAASTIIANNTKGFRPWINYLLVSKLAFAKTREIKSLRYKHHMDDFHGVNKSKFFQRPKLFHSPWEVKGWRFYLGSWFSGRVFKRHLRTMITK